MRAHLIGYGILIFGYFIALAFMSDAEAWVLGLGASVLVLAAKLVGEVSLKGVLSVLLMFNAALPLFVLWLLGTQSGMDAFMIKVLDEFDWVRALSPVLAGAVVHLLLSSLKAGVDGKMGS